MIYEYKCNQCETVHEVWAKMSDPAPNACPHCGAPKLERVISKTSFALKGSGWYTSDYKKPSSSDSEGGVSTSSAPSCESVAPCGAGNCKAEA
jgi:putative FmdB family regulatory protein